MGEGCRGGLFPTPQHKRRTQPEKMCPLGQQSIHQPWFDFRSPSLFYQAWYDQGLRAWDISNPYLPREVGYYLSPEYAGPGRVGRHTREAYQDAATGLIYMTDGNGWGPASPAAAPRGASARRCRRGC